MYLGEIRENVVKHQINFLISVVIGLFYFLFHVITSLLDIFL